MAVLLDRILDVLECCADINEGRSITEISETLSLHKSTVSRLANSLVHRHYLVRDPDTKRFRIGVKCVELSYPFLNSLDICKEAHPIMVELSLQSKYTVFLAIQQVHDVVYLDKADGSSGLQRSSIIGYRAPIHATALGKALLLQMGKEALYNFFAGYQYRSFTPNTKMNTEELIADILTGKEKGYVFDLEEGHQHVCCVAAPIYDCRGLICASLSVSATTEQWNDVSLDDLGLQVREAARLVSAKLGYQPAKNS